MEDNIPKIRFNGFEEPWRKSKLIDVVSSIDTGRSKFIAAKSGKYEILGSTSVIGFDNEYDYEGEFILTARVGNAGELYRHSGKVKISDNTVFIQGKQLDFIYYALQHFDIKKLSFGTAQHLVKASELKEQMFLLPVFDKEREQVGTLLLFFDNLIALHQQKVDQLKTLKKACLEKMFPKEGETVPEIRFKGFEGPWKKCTLGDVGKARSGIGFPDSEQGGKMGMTFYKVSDMNILGNETEMTNANNYVTEVQIIRNGWSPIEAVPAIIFAKVGAAVMLNRKRLCRAPFLLDNNTMAYSLDESKWDAEFAKALFANVDLTALVQVGALPSYNASDVEGIEISLAPLTEQKQIGRYFKELDNQIYLSQKKLDQLKNLKKALLDKMFV